MDNIEIINEALNILYKFANFVDGYIMTLPVIKDGFIYIKSVDDVSCEIRYYQKKFPVSLLGATQNEIRAYILGEQARKDNLIAEYKGIIARMEEEDIDVDKL